MSEIDVIKNFCEDYGYSFRDDYSGRGMFGKQCIGIVCDVSPVYLISCLSDTLRDEGFESCTDILGTPCTDSMGLSTIVYFPKLSVRKESRNEY